VRGGGGRGHLFEWPARQRTGLSDVAAMAVIMWTPSDTMMLRCAGVGVAACAQDDEATRTAGPTDAPIALALLAIGLPNDELDVGDLRGAPRRSDGAACSKERRSAEEERRGGGTHLQHRARGQLKRVASRRDGSAGELQHLGKE
jgi:hypothetical protein